MDQGGQTLPGGNGKSKRKWKRYDVIGSWTVRNKSDRQKKEIEELILLFEPCFCDGFVRGEKKEKQKETTKVKWGQF